MAEIKPINPAKYIGELPVELRLVANTIIVSIATVKSYTDRLLIAEAILKECLDWTQDANN